MREERSYAIVVACFAAGLYLAVLVAVFGLISLGTDTEVIPDPSAGPLVGPVMTGVAVAVLLVLLILTGIRVPGDQQRIAPLSALGAGVACYLAYCLAGEWRARSRPATSCTSCCSRPGSSEACTPSPSAPRPS
ncbi:DUF6121 family protein [Leifsonia sp. L25]|uniref:DUF6121 family protein n=1 Tax=Leifsonia sp. L25 TaxID=3423957 RepID=UPI003D69A2E5